MTMTCIVQRLALGIILLYSPAASFTGVHLPAQYRLLSRHLSDVSLQYSPKNPLENGARTESASNKVTSLPVSNIPVIPLEKPSSIIDEIMSSYWGPRILLAAVACLYGTNFPLGSIMDHALPASAATSARFVLASLALSPFLFQINKELIGLSLFAGCFTGMGYVTQALSLAMDTSPATVSFLGAAVVIWCPFLEWLVDKKPMGLNERPQTWLAGAMCLLGVGILELCGASSTGTSMFSGVGLGDGLALLQAMGFGTGLFLSEKMMKKHPNQALPITSVLVATTAFISMLWSLSDGWMGAAPGWQSMTLPNLLLEPSLHDVAFAVVWTGLLSTSLNFFLEVYALGRVPPGEASVILSTEPLWAAAFASVLLGESFGWNDYAGGFFIVAACLVNSLQASDLKRFVLGKGKNNLAEEKWVD